MVTIKYLIQNYPEKCYIIDPITGCWLWKFSISSWGYGYFKLNCKVIYAHVYFYENKFGKIPDSFVLDHIICNRRSCCNPDHVVPKTSGKNASRYQTEKTHCPQGHEYTENNILRYKNGYRVCRQCTRERSVRRRKMGTHHY